MDTKPFIDMVVAMDELSNIGHQNQLPWGSLPTDHEWYLTHATTTKDPNKRVALILGRLTFDDVMRFHGKYVSRWHFIVITRQTSETFFNTYPNVAREHVDVVHSFEQAALQGRRLLDSAHPVVESVIVFGGSRPYEEAIESKLIRRIYLTRIFAQLPHCDTRVSNFSLDGFRRIKRGADEVLADHDDRIVEENGWKYQFQVYERDES